jgi:TPP-dependent pyruvate/acetoin dehydrogenase alpha subunit
MLHMGTLSLPNYPAEITADPNQLPYSRDDLLKLYSAMRLARTFEERLAALYRQGKIFGAVYLGMGQEATSAGCASLLEPGDLFSTVARNLAAWFYRRVNPGHIMARWMGKDQPPSNGRELGLFLADMDGPGIAPYHNGSIASWIPSGAGFALSFKLRRQPNIYLAFTGDGGTSPGDFYEGLNFAAIHKLPLVIVCEVNQFAYSTTLDKQMPVARVADRAPAFNIYAETAFGNDIFEVIAAARRGIEHARNGGGPALIEFQTYRKRGHGEHDDCCYVPIEVKEFWEARDPIDMYHRWLLERGGLNSSDLNGIDQNAARSVEDAVLYAEAMPMPDPATVTDRLFAPSPHDPGPETPRAAFEPIAKPAIPPLTASATEHPRLYPAAPDRQEGRHF